MKAIPLLLRRTPVLLALAGAALVGTLPATAGAPAVPAPGPAADSTWLLSVAPGGLTAARDAVRGAGSDVVRSFGDLDVLAVRADAAALGRILRDPAVLGARANSAVTVASEDMGGTDRKAPTRNVYRDTIRSTDLAARGGTGAGVTVALVDTGVTPVPQLASRLVPVVGLDGARASCVNFTDEPTCNDEYGHGTFLAGLISGEGSHPGASAARLLSLKLSGPSGATDVSTLLAALQWVVAHRDVYDIDVLNLSVGTLSGVSWRVDPLNYAVQRAYDAGITVVASAGNTGPEPMSVMKPGDDPFVLTVGASDDRGSPGRGDDAVPLFSAQGPTRTDLLAKPDVVAPGARLISLRAPGSTIEQNVPGGLDADYRRASGTSMATAVVSGAVAQLLSLRPTWTPAQVKSAVMATATPLLGQPYDVVGRGLVDVLAASTYGGSLVALPADRSAGTGGLTGARGRLQVVDEDTGVPLTGEQTAAGGLFDPTAYRTTGWSATNWQATNWQATNWQATNWQATNWQATNWQATNWQATNWQATNWQATNWQATNWQGSTADPTAYYGRPGHGSAVLGAWE